MHEFLGKRLSSRSKNLVHRAIVAEAIDEECAAWLIINAFVRQQVA